MKKILVATDLSSRSDRAVLRAIKLAKTFKSKLIIAHIIDEDTPRSIIEETRKIAEKEINYCIKGKTKDVKIEIKIIIGTPHIEILKIVNEENIDLVVLGLHRHVDDGDPMIGKVVERIVKSSMKPVLIVKERSEIDYNNILIGVDFNIHSRKSLKLALGTFPASKFHILHSYQIPFLGIVGDNAELDRQVRNDSATELDNMIKETIKDLPKKSGKDYKIQQKLIKGDALKALEEEALYLKPELLALGTRGYTGFARMMAVNLTESILINPPCDVLVVM